MRICTLFIASFLCMAVCAQESRFVCDDTCSPAADMTLCSILHTRK